MSIPHVWKGKGLCMDRNSFDGVHDANQRASDIDHIFVRILCNLPSWSANNTTPEQPSGRELVP